MDWKIADTRNLFPKLNSKLGHCHVVLTTPQTSPKNVAPAVVELQQLPEIGNTIFKEEDIA